MNRRWDARADCHKCNTGHWLAATIPEDRVVPLFPCDGCGGAMTYTPTDTSEFGMIVWRELLESITFVTNVKAERITLE